VNDYAHSHNSKATLSVKRKYN